MTSAAPFPKRETSEAVVANATVMLVDAAEATYETGSRSDGVFEIYIDACGFVCVASLVPRFGHGDLRSVMK